ncbi:uncharacterized protein BJ171DRAFT_499015 [Polychytrium aggregatum]|uniref:uncharacterized protein n=1 Tax=Polychytrium aggregatum TaxID=110093 RepID=UPI0022FDB85B|nr:uncharacterized protein BJ171DRAFT_499015 [Polychytrium aggregatum]KAI9206171.1 hypothetical protein BJ171DRAFT_499015 [Polychytrium aggregatum]
MDYDDFLGILRKKQAHDLMNKLKTFLVSTRALLKSHQPVQVHKQAISTFLENINHDCLEHPLFADLTAEQKEGLVEVWEKLVMTKLHDVVFEPHGSEEAKMNTQLQTKISSFAWIQERHLDLDIRFNSSLEVAQGELLRISGFRAPRDKLVILQNTIQLVVDLIKRYSGNVSADKLLPVLILVVVRANPPQLISHIKYIMRFRNHAEVEKGSVQFVLTNMMGAVTFIYNMNIKSLTLSADEMTQFGLESAPDTPRPSMSSSKGGSSVKITQLASVVYSSTSGFLTGLFKEVREIGESAVGTVDQLVDNVRGKANATSNRNSQTLQTTSTSSSSSNLIDFDSPKGDTTPNPSRVAESEAAISPQQLELDEEEFQLQLALALSLSEAEHAATTVQSQDDGSIQNDLNGLQFDS